MAFGQFLSVFSENQRDVSINGQGPIHRIVNQHLSRGIVQMIVTANNMGDAHIKIIDHNRQHINRCPVRAQQDHIIQLIVADCDIALHLIFDDSLPALRGFYPDHKRGVRMVFLIDIPPRALK